MILRIFRGFTRICISLMNRYLPDPFLFCILLTFVVFISSFLFTNLNTLSILDKWGTSFWNLLAFSMQMIAILVTGMAMANSPSIAKLLSFIVSKLRTQGHAIIVVSIVSCIASLINWGFGLILGVILAKQIAKKMSGVDYRLLIASSYSGFLLFHGGLSGSIPLILAAGGKTLEVQTAGNITQAIPLSQTIFSPLNIVLVIGLLILIPLMNYLMIPQKKDVFEADKSIFKDEDIKNTHDNSTFSNRIENSKLMTYLISIIGFSYLIHYMYKTNFSVNLNIVIFFFLFLGILLHRTPRGYINAINIAIKGTGGIFLQFPFYAGMIGVMSAIDSNGTSLVLILSNFFVSISNEITFNLFTFISAGILNIFVPSGGGQWSMQAAIVTQAAKELGIDMATASMAVAWGDAWTNMIQPFWALPALAIAGLGAKDIMGYCCIILITSFFFIGGMFLIFAAF